MPEKSIKDIIFQVRYGGMDINSAVTEIKGILKEKLPKKAPEFGGTYADVHIVMGGNMMIDEILKIIEEET